MEGVAVELDSKIAARSAVVGVLGQGYVGLPLAAAAARAGFRVVGFDIDARKVEQLNRGESYVDAVTSEELAAFLSSGRFEASADLGRLGGCDVLAICVPTPLTATRDPDMRFVTASTASIASTLRPGQLIVLESTTYPGTTEELVEPMLEGGGLRCGIDFFLGFSPEREDPGNTQYKTTRIPKVIAGRGETSGLLVEKFYSAIFDKVVRVSSTKVAEAVKITENVFRAVNIALVNELKVIYGSMGIDVWEVVNAAATKPFGYMPFYPGPGLGGHCIPIDPFYLAWKAREYGLATRLVEVAGEINLAMPRYVIAKLEEAVDRRLGISLSASRVLMVGLSYKRNVADIRESPSLALLELMEARGTKVVYHDPYVPEIPITREHSGIAGRRSVSLSDEILEKIDVALIATDHDGIDYDRIARRVSVIVDTRNVMERRGYTGVSIIKA